MTWVLILKENKIKLLQQYSRYFGLRLCVFESQAEKMRAQLASLPPLCPPKLPQVSKDSSMPPEGLNTGIYRRTDQLLATLLKLSSEVKVVDVTGKTAGPCLCVHTTLCSPLFPFIHQLRKRASRFLLQSAPAPS